ncbi:MAG TPA: hypothetical protein VMC02_09450 [Steroidobacteraceae bacterium]|nr:hypothetical protein [Steroidobacteraceae bacterium]
MIWHILKKDLRLLWPLAALVAGLHLCAAMAHHFWDMESATVQLQVIGDLLSLLALLGVAVLVLAALHQDAIPGVRQDWLTRPIRRGDLIISKAVFVVLLVQAPLWLVDSGAALADGFDLKAALAAATGHNLAVLCKLALPALMIGAVTRSLVEAFVVAAVGLVLCALFFWVVVVTLLGIKAGVPETGAGWLVEAAFYILAIVGATLILSLQYLGRRTLLSRWLIGLGGATVIASAFMPWQLAFGLQRAVSAEPLADRGVELHFDGQLGPYRLPRGAAPNLTAALYLPLRATGVPDGYSVLMDHADVVITALDGTPLYRGKSNISVDGLGSIVDAQFEIRGGRSPVPGVYQRIYLPAGVRARLGDRPVRIAIDESMTLFRPQPDQALPAIGGHAAMGDLGRCATRIDAEGDDVAIRCLGATRQPSCLSAWLEDPAAGVRNPEVHRCIPDYSPSLIAPLYPDAFNRVGGELPFFDRSGLVHYPIDGSRLATSHLVIHTYVPIDHFTRHIDTPAVTVSQLSGMASSAAEPPGWDLHRDR